MPSRRRLLRLGATAALTLPFLRRVEAAEKGPVPTRLVVWFTPNGIDLLKPSRRDPTAFDLPPSLEPFRRQLLLVDGVDFQFTANRDAHEAGTMLSFTNQVSDRENLPTGPSVDQTVAAAWAPPTRFGSLQLGVQVRGNPWKTKLSFDAGGAGLPADNDPASVFGRLFGDVVAPPSRGADPIALAAARKELEAHRRRRTSVLDALAAELAQTRRLVGRANAALLDAHLESLRAVERRLAGGTRSSTAARPMTTAPVSPTRSCGRPTPPAWPARDSEHFPEHGRLQMDNLALAFACDATRVASLMWSGSGSNLRHTWAGSQRQHHADLAHGPPEVQEENRRVNQWYAEQFASFLARLARIPEGAGSVLDHTLVIWGSEMASGGHRMKDGLFVLAGGASGRMRGGRWLRQAGRSHGDLLAGVCRAMGLEVAQYGDPRFSEGVIDLA